MLRLWQQHLKGEAKTLSAYLAGLAYYNAAILKLNLRTKQTVMHRVYNHGSCLGSTVYFAHPCSLEAFNHKQISCFTESKRNCMKKEQTNVSTICTRVFRESALGGNTKMGVSWCEVRPQITARTLIQKVKPGRWASNWKVYTSTTCILNPVPGYTSRT